MSVLDQLACALGRRDEVPNQQLAHRLVETEDSSGIREVVENLSNKDKNIRFDCVKVLYEIGYLKPELVAPYALEFLKLLKSRENRLIWGGMIALSTIGRIAADELFPRWIEIQTAMNSGSVITRDGGVLTLAGIASANMKYNAAVFPHLLDHLRTCRPKDVPQHAEKILLAVNAGNKDGFMLLLEQRLQDLQGNQLKRVHRIIHQAKER